MTLYREVLGAVIEITGLGSQGSGATARPARLLEHSDLASARSQLTRACQPGDAGADYSNAKVFRKRR